MALINEKKGRGKKWPDEEVRLLLEVAVEIDVSVLYFLRLCDKN